MGQDGGAAAELHSAIWQILIYKGSLSSACFDEACNACVMRLSEATSQQQAPCRRIYKYENVIRVSSGGGYAHLCIM